VPIRNTIGSGHSPLRIFLYLGTLSVVLILLTACSPTLFEQGPIQNSEFSFCKISSGESIGQTFVAHERGFEGVQVFLQKEKAGTGRITFHLWTEPGADHDLRTSILPIDEVTQAGFYLFNFEPLTDSRQKYYYGFLAIEGDGTLSTRCLPGDAYIDGALYRNHEPQDSQLHFRLAYDRLQAFIGLGMETVKWAGIFVIGILLYVVPGLALLQALWPDSKHPMMVQVALGTGISLAIYPILMLWTDVIGLHLGPLYAWIPVVMGSLYLIWGQRKLRSSKFREKWQAWLQSRHVIPDLLLILILGLIFFSRFYAVRTLDVPMWGDSYQHTMIAQLLVDNGGLFDSWEPYAPLTSFTYHFGFHSDVAVFQWMTGRSAIRSILWVGQILNAMAILSVYPLALKVGKNKWAGIVAVLLAGLLAPMPNYFTNWGRYTQLAGLCILPIAIYLAWSLLEREKVHWKFILIGWILLAGLALTHYRVLVFAIAFFPAILVQSLQQKKVKRSITQIAFLASGAIIIFLPWLIHVWPSITMETFVNLVRTPADSTSAFNQQYNAVGDLNNFLPMYLWLLLFVSIAYSLWKNSRDALTMILWWGLILILANPAWLSLPGTGALSNFAVFISIYILAAIFIGSGVGWAFQTPQKNWITPILIFLILVSIPYGFSSRYKEIDPTSHAIVTRPDLRAARWIQPNTNDFSQFFVNGFFAYAGTIVVGSDAGWWLPMIADRGNTVQPINYVSEESEQDNFPNYANNLYDSFRNLNINDSDFIRELKARGITHVYVGQRGGRVNYSGPHVIQPDMVLLEDNYDLIYHEDRVWIFQIR